MKSINKQKHPLFNTYRGMKERCYYPKNKRYKNYGGRGITVCDRWLESFWNFVEDMGDKPTGYTLDRIDNNLGYYKENCRWASAFTQSQNTTNCKKSKNYYLIKRGNYTTYLVLIRRNNQKISKTFKTETEAIQYVAQLRKNYAETH